jgi:hypothetical protein
LHRVLTDIGDEGHCKPKDRREACRLLCSARYRQSIGGLARRGANEAASPRPWKPAIYGRPPGNSAHKLRRDRFHPRCRRSSAVRHRSGGLAKSIRLDSLIFLENFLFNLINEDAGWQASQRKTTAYSGSQEQRLR